MPITVSPTLQAAYEDGDKVIIRTLSFASTGQTGLNFVHGYEQFTANDDDYLTITYEPTTLDIQFSPRETTLANKLTFTVGISQEFFQSYRSMLDTAAFSGNTINVIYREYLEGSADPAYPGIALKAQTATYANNKLKLVAALDDIINAAFPNKFYTARDFSGLTYYGR